MPLYHSDHPTIADSLGRSDLLVEVGSRVKDCSPPHVIGIYGDWGSGKTSFLRSLQFYLNGVTDIHDEPRLSETRAKYENLPASDPEHSEWREAEGMSNILNLKGACQGYPVVWFDAWRYQTEPAPIIALLHEIRRQFSPGAKLWNFIKRDAAIAAQSSLLAFEQLTKSISEIAPGAEFIGKAISNVPKVAEEYEKRHLLNPLTTEQIRQQLNYAIKQMVESLDENLIRDVIQNLTTGRRPRPRRKQRLTIIIDDLDRCEPAVALRLLEGIKVFLSLENCVFVLGVNPSRLVDHIANAYYNERKEGSSIDACRHRAKDYLDKIVSVHYSFGLPASMDKVVQSHMPSLDIAVKESGVRTKRKVDLKAAVEEILIKERCLPPNPRKIKGFMSTLSRYERTEWPFDPDPQLFAIFAYLNHFHPGLIRTFQWHPEAIESFFTWCSNPWDDPWTDFEGFSPSASTTDTSATQPPSKEADGGKRKRTRYPDPINDNVIQVQDLIVKWWTGDPKEPDSYDPYILLG